MSQEKPVFQIEVDDSELIKLLDELKQRTSDLKPVLQVIGELMKTSVKRNFEVGGRYSEPGSWRGGTRSWDPLSLATLFAGQKSKYVTKKGKFRKGVEEKFRNRHILFRTGRLMKSITYQASRYQLSVGTNVIYAAIHNFGGPAGRGKKVHIPARPYLVVQNEDLERIRGILMKHLMGEGNT